MSIQHRVLGGAGRDNALLLHINTGQAVDRVLFDCGEGVLAALPFAEIQRIDHLCFSHLHMDHIGGFDSFFRCTYNRTLKPNVIWGPPQTARILHHRLQGFLWNLHEGKAATWRVCDVDEDEVACTRFELEEAFARAHPEAAIPRPRPLISAEGYTVEAVHLHHHTPSLGYVVREGTKQNVDPARMEVLGLRPGPWIKALKQPLPDQVTVEIEGATFALAELRRELLTEAPGDSVAYLTDFLLDDAAYAKLLPLLQGVGMLVCESAYLEADADLARQNAHLTARQAAELARAANAGKLLLIHLSDRHPSEQWPKYLAEARAVFPNTEFPRGW